jgi:hypothetical protein
MRSNFGNIAVVSAPIDGTDFGGPNPIPASQLPFMFSWLSSFGLKAADAPVTGEYELGFASNPGTLTGFHAKVTVPGSAASVTVDLKKNGTSILAAPITLTSSTPAGTPLNATIVTPTFAAGDRFTALLTMSSNTGMTGVSCRLNGVENSQPL